MLLNTLNFIIFFFAVVAIFYILTKNNWIFLQNSL